MPKTCFLYAARSRLRYIKPRTMDAVAGELSWLEHGNHNPGVGGSSPSPATINPFLHLQRCSAGKFGQVSVHFDREVARGMSRRIPDSGRTLRHFRNVPIAEVVGPLAILPQHLPNAYSLNQRIVR